MATQTRPRLLSLLACLLISWSLSAAAIGAAESVSVATFEIKNDTGERLPGFEGYSDKILQAAIREFPGVLPVGDEPVYRYIVFNQIQTWRLYGSPEGLADVGKNAGARFLISGSAHGYAQTGDTESLEVELFIVDVPSSSYVFRKTYRASRSVGDRKGHREL